MMKIAILLYEGVTALDAIGPYEVLNSLPDSKIHFVAKQPGPKRTDSGALALVADYSLDQVPHPDIIVVPGSPAGMFAVMKDKETLNWLQTAHETSQWTTSVCTGSLILGAAGLLRQKKATTHWSAMTYLSLFGKAHPTHERVVQEGKIITAAGVSAGIDMALYLVQQIAGTETAQTIQLLIEYDPQPPFYAGSLETAPAPIVKKARRQLAAVFAQLTGQQLKTRLRHLLSSSQQPQPDTLPDPLPETPV